LAKNGKLLVPWLSEQIENNRARTVFGESPIDCTARKILSLLALEYDFHILKIPSFLGRDDDELGQRSAESHCAQRPLNVCEILRHAATVPMRFFVANLNRVITPFGTQDGQSIHS
jgi:hypothetical protein